MKRHLLLAIAIIAALATFTWMVREVRGRRRAATNIVKIHSALATYRQDLKPGTTRQQVDDYLKSKDPNVQLSHKMEGGTLADRIVLGQEPSPWYCSEMTDYSVFSFHTPDSYPVNHRLPRPGPLDRLSNIDLETVGEGCL